VVLATARATPSAREVAEAFTAAVRRYGVPSEVLSDNGDQFTGRFIKPLPVEVLFEKICRGNGIKHRLTTPITDHDGQDQTLPRPCARSSSTMRRRLS
jgi:hypothetical protein